MGSGFIFDEEGYILTNRHVVTGATEIIVTLTDGRVFEGKLMGTCRISDIAVVRIDAGDLTVAELVDSDKLRIGQRVFAIGNPFGLVGGPTVTAGVISAVNRTVHFKEGVFRNLVQTDTAINPGNSGGPLINMEGQVIAMNTALIPYAQGIGFAISINLVKNCAEDIIIHGGVVKPWLGIMGLNISRRISAYYELPVERGVLVSNVATDSPVSRAGIRRGDIILEFDRREVNSIEELQSFLMEKKPGDKVQLMILRNSKKREIDVILERPS